MAFAGLAGCAGCLGMAAFVACGGGTLHAPGFGTRLLQRRVEATLAVAGQLGLVSLLLRAASWRSLAEEASAWFRHRRMVVGRDGSCAALMAAVVAASLGASLFARSPVGVPVGVIGSCVGVAVWHASRVRAKERALVDEMPEVFRTLAMALGSGETLMQAIEYVGVHERGYAGRAFAQAALRMRCGASAEEAMAQLSRDLEAPGVGLLTTALVIAQRTGSPLRGLLQSSAALVERQGEYERMLAVKTAQVRLSVRIVCLLPLVLVCLLSLISVDFQAGLATLPGTLSLLVAALMDGCALMIIRHLMRGVL